MLFTQIIHKSKWTHKFLKISQYLEKYSSTVQPLTYSSWHQENRQKELLIGGGEEVGDGRAKGSSAIGDKQAAISLMPDGWWHGFRFLAGISPVYPREWLLQPPRTILRPGPVPPKLPSASSGEENPPAIPCVAELWFLGCFFFSCLSSSHFGTWHFLAVPDMSNRCFYTCFQTPWAWSKDTAYTPVLYTVLHSKVLKSTELVEDERTWQRMPDPCRLTWVHTHVFESSQLEGPHAGGFLFPYHRCFPPVLSLLFCPVGLFAVCKWIAVHLTSEFFLGNNLTVRLQPRHLHQL